jgi:hypothetical protein
VTPEPISREERSAYAAWPTDADNDVVLRLLAALEAGEALAQALTDLVESPAEFDDKHVRYISVQVERSDLDAALTALAAWRARVQGD